MNTKTSTPAQIDAEIARINGEIARLENTVGYKERELERFGSKMLDSRRERVTKEIQSAREKIEAHQSDTDRLTPIKCGWKQAVADIQAVLDRQEQP